MQRISEMMKTRAAELLKDGTVCKVLGWKTGEFYYDMTPASFETPEQLEDFVYNSFCAANLSKYLIDATKKAEGKVLAFLKPCDTYSFNQLLCEHRIDRDKVYIIGVGSSGMLDIEKIRIKGIKGITGMEEAPEEITFQTIYGEKKCTRQDVLLERCRVCKGDEHMIFDELIGEELGVPETGASRFAGVERLEAMTPDERFVYWRGELSRCIRCNACRNVCPACSCLKCVFDNPGSGVSSKANTDDFEENMFHIIRAFHVAGRCTDCGECSRVCPQSIPLHLLNRKFIKDINEFYGDYQAGADPTSVSPLTAYTTDDVEPGIVHQRGGAR